MPNISWPWAIILCRFNDKPTIPQNPDYYQDLFTRNGTGGLCDYWRDVSLKAIDITSSQVFGWFTMNRPSTDVALLTFPGDRWKLIQWGKDAAVANGVDLTPFRSILVVQNYGVDHGAAGGNVVIVHQTPTLCEFGFICHEMGHSFLGDHSWSANPDFQYGDGWDLMSFATTTFQFPISFKGTQGSATVGLNARNLEVLNAVPPGRRWLAHADFSEQMVLDPLNQPQIGNHGFLIAKIPPNGTVPARANNSSYTVEFHSKAGWDQAIPADTVTIHEIRANSISYLQPTMGSNFTSGQQFVTPDPKVFINIVSISSNPATATIRMWDLAEGGLRKEDSDPKVYIIQNGTKCWIPSPGVLAAMGKTFADVRVVPDGALATVPNGPDVQILQVSVTPYPVGVNKQVTINVHVTNTITGANVAGQVIVDGVSIGNTNTSISHRFNTKKKLISTNPRVWDIIYPSGEVNVAGLPSVAIDFGFS